MALDFLTVDWGRLQSAKGTQCMKAWYNNLFLAHQSNHCRSARIVFKAGKNQDGYFTCNDLIEQVDKAIDIFEERTNGFATGLFLFDNAPSHQKQADDALSARKMPKNPSLDWVHWKGVARMCNASLPNGQPQNLYFEHDHPTMPGWFKGMEVIIRERGFWPEEGLSAQCESFRCKNSHTNCCCWHLLFCQPDFMTQKICLEEFVTLRGHICDFYPKYHCELNFIEQYWGAIKFHYCNTTHTTNIVEMEKNMLICLDDVPLIQMIQYGAQYLNVDSRNWLRFKLRYANWSARFISAYDIGLSGAEAAWANKKYHGHCTLPPIILMEMRQAQINMPAPLQ